jgi:hypothetical protein
MSPANTSGSDEHCPRIEIRADNNSVAAGYIENFTWIHQEAAKPKASGAVLAVDNMQLNGPPFVGRQDQLDRIASALGADGDTERKLIVVAGPPGVGKTAVAKQAACAAQGARQFTYALFADMRGYEDEANKINPEGVYPSLLLGLGLPDSDIPSNPGEQATLYHRVMQELARAGKRVLLVLDNVSDPKQFDLLVPSDAIHRVVLTTRETFAQVSRNYVIDLDVLDHAEALSLLVASARSRNHDDDRFEREVEATARLAELCDRLPLALQIVAALLADEPNRSVAEIVSELEEEEHRLDALHYDDRVSVRAALSLSYNRLPDELRRLFRLMSVVSGGDVGLDVARWLTDSCASEIRPRLMALVRSHLIQQPISNRWTMHDLVYLYASEQAATDPEDAARAFTAMIERFHVTVGAAGEWLTAVASDTGRKSSPRLKLPTVGSVTSARRSSR